MVCRALPAQWLGGAGHTQSALCSSCKPQSCFMHCLGASLETNMRAAFTRSTSLVVSNQPPGLDTCRTSPDCARISAQAPLARPQNRQPSAVLRTQPPTFKVRPAHPVGIDLSRVLCRALLAREFARPTSAGHAHPAPCKHLAEREAPSAPSALWTWPLGCCWTLAQARDAQHPPVCFSVHQASQCLSLHPAAGLLLTLALLRRPRPRPRRATTTRRRCRTRSRCNLVL